MSEVNRIRLIDPYKRDSKGNFGTADRDLTIKND